MDHQLETDEQLVAKCQSDDPDEFEQAFEALYVRYRDRAYSIAARITSRQADAMDVVQETFSQVFRKIGSFRSDSQFSTWLFRIVVNCSIDNLRQARGISRHLTYGIESGLADAVVDTAAPDPHCKAESNELSAHVQASIGRLSPKLRAILVLRYQENMSYDDLSRTLELSMGTVKSRLARAHIALQHVLSGSLTKFGFTEIQRGGVA